MKSRILRMAWSVTWCVVAVLLCVLWVRSYWSRDFFQWHWLDRDYSMDSNFGELSFQRMRVFSVPFSTHGGSLPALPRKDIAAPPHYRIAGINWSIFDRGWAVGVSTAVPLTASLAAAIIPWMSPVLRFSLRTLLIATTLVAIMLGLVVWSTRT